MAALAAAAITREVPRIYEADASVLVKPAQPLNVGTTQPDSSVTTSSDQVAATDAQLMTQPALLGQVSSELHLGWTPDTMASKVKVTPQSGTTLLKVAVTDTSPQRASSIANRMVKDFSTSQSRLLQQSLVPQTRVAQSQVNQAQQAVSADQTRINNQLSSSLTLANGQLSPQDQAKLTTLQQQLTADDTQLQSAQAGLLQLQAQAALTSDRVIVVSPATVPSSPVWPRLFLNVLLAAAAGLLIAVGILSLIKRMDQTVKGDAELQRRTGLIPLGHIPVASAARTRMGELVVLGKSPAASEAYRSLRTNLLFASLDRPVKTIVITSPATGEGKSRTAANLAIVLAAAGRTTLLVDADFRNPAIHGFFGMPSKSGLSELILNDGYLDEPNERSHDGNDRDGEEPLIRPVPEVPGLSVLAAGTTPPNPSELLGSERVRTLLGELASRFDHVVLDTPPLSEVTDPALVAAHADATLLVIEQGRTHLGSLLHARNQLDNVGARLLGVVVNKVRAQGATYGYGDYGYHRQTQEVASNAVKASGSGEEVHVPTQ